jgi:hypothetical protein
MRRNDAGDHRHRGVCTCDPRMPSGPSGRASPRMTLAPHYWNFTV